MRLRNIYNIPRLLESLYLKQNLKCKTGQICYTKMDLFDRFIKKSISNAVTLSALSRQPLINRSTKRSSYLDSSETRAQQFQKIRSKGIEPSELSMNGRKSDANVINFYYLIIISQYETIFNKIVIKNKYTNKPSLSKKHRSPDF